MGGGNLGVTDGNSGGCDQLEPSEITPSPSGTETFVPTSVPTNTNSEDPKTFAPTTTETVVFPPTSTESPVDNTFGPTLTESIYLRQQAQSHQLVAHLLNILPIDRQLLILRKHHLLLIQLRKLQHLILRKCHLLHIQLSHLLPHLLL